MHGRHTVMDLPAPTYVPADTSGARAIVILAWLFPALATVAVALRVVSRRIQRLKFGVDDILIAVALVSSFRLLFAANI